MLIQKTQLKQIFKHLPPELSKDKEARGVFISDFTAGRVTSTGDLTSDEGDELIASLTGDYTHYGTFNKGNKQHLTVLNICYDLGWTAFNEKQQRTVADLNQLGAWIISKRSPVRKPLSQMNRKETSILIQALKGILISKYKK